MARICFFARVRSLDFLDRLDFYVQDIRALRELGHEVVVAHRIPRLRPADVYYVWWWTWAFAPAALARALGRPMIVGGVLEDRPLDSRVAAHRWVMRAVLASADANVFVSRHEFERVTRRERVRNPRYVPLGVDTDLFSPAGERDPSLVFSIGWTQTTTAIRKCYPEVVRAAIELCRARPALRFVLAGKHGDYHPVLRRMVDESGLGERITFPGVFTVEQKIDHMRRCGVYLQPSRFEGFGLAIAEAMSCGAPVVTSPAGEAAHVGGDAVLQVDGTRPDHIAAGVLRLLGDEALRRELGARARRRIVGHFSYARRRDGIAAVLEQVLSGHAGATPHVEDAMPPGAAE